MATRARAALDGAKMALEVARGPERVDAAEAVLSAALGWLQELAGPDVKPLGTRVNAESEYAWAYDELVRLGARPRLRAKYRAGR